jgi:hypothetical protein
LRGVFPEDKYVAILQILENILNLMLEMEQALAKIPHEWRMSIVQNTWKERKVMVSCIKKYNMVKLNSFNRFHPI